MVEKMPSHTKTPPEFLMFEQRVGCVKVVLPKKEMVALSVAIQRQNMARDRAPEQRALPIKVVMTNMAANISSSSSDEESSESHRKL